MTHLRAGQRITVSATTSRLTPAVFNEEDDEAAIDLGFLGGRFGIDIDTISAHSAVAYNFHLCEIECDGQPRFGFGGPGAHSAHFCPMQPYPIGLARKTVKIKFRNVSVCAAYFDLALIGTLVDLTKL